MVRFSMYQTVKVTGKDCAFVSNMQKYIGQTGVIIRIETGEMTNDVHYAVMFRDKQFFFYEAESLSADNIDPEEAMELGRLAKDDIAWRT